MLRTSILLVTALLALPVSAQPNGVARASASLSAALQREYPNEQGRRITTSHEDAGFATVVRAGFDPPLYPGTGVLTVLVDSSGRTYGQHGERDFAELARALGWLRAAPSTEVFVRALSLAVANGMLVHRTTPTLELAGGVLRCVLRRAEPMSGREVETWTIEVRASGPVSIARGPIDAPPAPPPREILAQAGRGAAVDAMQLLAALRSIEGSVDPELRGWLAAISTTEAASDAIPSEAIRAIGSNRAAADALRARWQPLSPERRELLLDLAANHHGTAFRGRIER
jgi:hypothetical protein